MPWYFSIFWMTPIKHEKADFQMNRRFIIRIFAQGLFKELSEVVKVLRYGKIINKKYGQCEKTDELRFRDWWTRNFWSFVMIGKLTTQAQGSFKFQPY